MSSGWAKEATGAIAIEHTASLVYNNLCTNGAVVAYIHKEDVYAFQEAASDGKTDAAVERLPYNDSHPVLGLKWAEADDTSYLVVCTTQGFQVLDATGRRLVHFFMLSSVMPAADDALTFCRGVTSVPGANRILVGTSAGDILGFDVRREAFTKSLTAKDHTSSICCLHATAEYVASGDSAGRIVVWGAASMTKHCAFEGAGYPCTCVAVRDDTVVAAYASGHVRIFRIGGKRLFCEIAAHARCVTAMDLHPTKGTFVTVGEDAVLNVWSLPDGESKGSSEVSLDICAPVPDRLLTGVQFGRGGGGDTVLAATYDTHSVQYWTKA